MLGPRRFTGLLALGVALASACGPQRLAGPTRPEDALVVLLLDAETGTAGRLAISNAAGSVTLEAAHEAARVSAGQAPGPAGHISQADLEHLFGDALAALPPPPKRFTLNFRFESNELTDESRALVPEILRTIRERAAPDVVVVGHTDTSGPRDANVGLGLKRAMTVRGLLVVAGLDASAIEVTSHGEMDLLIPTPDETPEPRNRRVEIAVR